MKTVISVIGCGIVAFVGMQAYLGVQRPQPAPLQTAQTADEVNADEAPRPDDLPRPAVPGEGRAQTPEQKPEPAPMPKPLPRQAPPAPTKNTSRPASPYFVTEGPYNKGIPSRVVLHNLSIGTLTILLLSDRRSTGELYITRGKKEGHAWEVQVRSGSVNVLWDGNSLPQR
jgi:hypothetical protein